MKNGSLDYNALAQGLADMGKPDEAIKVLQYKQAQEQKSESTPEIKNY